MLCAVLFPQPHHGVQLVTDAVHPFVVMVGPEGCLCGTAGVLTDARFQSGSVLDAHLFVVFLVVSLVLQHVDVGLCVLVVGFPEVHGALELCVVPELGSEFVE